MKVTESKTLNKHIKTKICSEFTLLTLIHHLRFNFRMVGFIGYFRLHLFLHGHSFISILGDFISNQQQVKRMKELTFELKLLIVVHTIEDVSTCLQNIIHYLCLGEILRVVVHFGQHLGILGISLLLELFISINFVAFRFQQPGHSLGVNHILLILAYFEGVGGIEDFIIVDVVIIFAKQELDALLVLLCFQVIEF